MTNAPPDPQGAGACEVREALAALGWTTGQLAALVHCNPRTVRRWIDGSRVPPLYVLSYLHVSRLLLNGASDPQ